MSLEKVKMKDFVNSISALEVCKASDNHIRFFQFTMFKNKVQGDEVKCKNLRKHLTNLCMLYGLNELQKDCRFCYESGFFQAGVDYASIIAEAIKKVCK